MTPKLIIYQLNDTNADYPSISQQIKNFPNWAKIMDRCWIVKSRRKPGEIRDKLSQSIKNGGKIFVIELDNNSWGTFAVNKDVTTWLKENI